MDRRLIRKPRGPVARRTLPFGALDGLLASLQRDSSVSLWDTAADRSFGEIYPFADGSWAAVMADGTILGSADGQEEGRHPRAGAHLWEAGAAPLPRRSPCTIMTRADRRMLRILLCDDHPILREGLKKILLQQSDIKVVEEAGSGAEMLEKSAASRFDVIILDITLPDMNGLDVLKNLQSAGHRPASSSSACTRRSSTPRAP